MIAGFVGSKTGMTSQQRFALEGLLKKMAYDIEEFHHGDSLGSDEQAHYIASSLGFKIVIHPPNNPIKRAFCKSKIILKEFEPRERIKHLVDSVDILIATLSKISLMYPNTSDTVFAINYAKKKSKQVYLIYPNGKCIITVEKSLNSNYTA